MSGAAVHDVGPRKRATFRLLVSTAAVIVIVDAVTKIVAVDLLEPRDSLPIMGEQIMFTVVRSRAPGWLGSDRYTWILTIAATAVAAGIVWWGRRLGSLLWATGLGLLLGGALGNVLDRLFRAPGPLHGAVIDFVMIDPLPVFNVADAAVVCATIVLLYLSWARIPATAHLPQRRRLIAPDTRSPSGSAGFKPTT